MGWNYCIREHSELVVIWRQANQHLNVGSTELRSRGRVDRQREGGQGGTKDDTGQGWSKNQRRDRHEKQFQQRFPSCGAGGGKRADKASMSYPLVAAIDYL